MDMNMQFEVNEKTMPSLASCAMLVDLNIGVWTGRKLDRKTSHEVDAAKEAKTKVSNVVKNLFAGMPELDQIRSFVANVRNWHYANTHPWSDSGTRLLAMTHYFAYLDKMRQFEAEYQGLVETFKMKYPEMINIAAFKLGKFFDRAEYPDVNTITSKFYFNISLYPVPISGDIRVDVQDEVRKELIEQFDAFTQRAVTQINETQWGRLREILEHLVDRLSDRTEEELEKERAKQEARNQKREEQGKEAKEREIEDRRRFRKGLVENAINDVDLLTQLEVVGDRGFKEACNSVKEGLAGITSGQLKQDDKLRRETKETMQDILDKMRF